jgi:hypothetical protein
MTVSERIREWVASSTRAEVASSDPLGADLILLEHGEDIAAALEAWSDAQRLMMHGWSKHNPLETPARLKEAAQRARRLGFGDGHKSEPTYPEAEDE